MSRHRHLRGRLPSYDDNYDGDPTMFEDEDDGGDGTISRRNSGRNHLSTFFEPPPKTEDEMRDCFFAVADALPSFTDKMVNDAIYDKNYDADAAIIALLGGEYGYPPGWEEGSAPPMAQAGPQSGPPPGFGTAAQQDGSADGSGGGEAAAAGATGAATGAGAGSNGADSTGAGAGGAGAGAGAGAGSGGGRPPPSSPLGGGVFVLTPSKPPKPPRSASRGRSEGADAPSPALGSMGRLSGEDSDGGSQRPASVARNLDAYTIDDGRAIDGGERKPVINLVVVGHVDAGKSTLMGHLLYKLGGVSSKALHKFKNQSRIAGKASFAFAWVLDQHDEERERGVTMDVGTNFFETANRNFVLLDAPGHKDFIPNMITGVAQADAAVLVVPAKPDEFEVAFSVAGQTREHAILLRNLGVKRLVVAVNKMDTVDWSKARFKEIKELVGAYLKTVGFKSTNLVYVPVSGIDGLNLDVPLSRETREHKWYTGPCLLEALDALPNPSRQVDKPLRMCVSDVYKRMGLGVVVSGKIESGRLVPGNRVTVMPSNESAGVKGIEINNLPVRVAVAGENVEVGLGGVTIESLRAGIVLCHPRHPIPLAMKIKAQIFTLPAMRIPLVAGQQLTFHMHHLEEPCNVTKLLRIVNEKTGRTKVKRPRCVLREQTAAVRIKFLRPLPLETFSDNRRLGRFMLRYAGDTVAAGLVKKIMK